MFGSAGPTNGGNKMYSHVEKHMNSYLCDKLIGCIFITQKEGLDECGSLAFAGSHCGHPGHKSCHPLLVNSGYFNQFFEVKKENNYSPSQAIKNRFFFTNAAKANSKGSLRDGGGPKVNARL